MVFRKPYAFFIKYFKLFHVIMTVITFYMIYKSTAISAFLGDYVSAPGNIIGQVLADRFFNFFMFFGTFVLIIMATAILILMKFKEKPITFYIFNTFVYVATFVVFLFTNYILGRMEVEILDIRIVKAVQDIFTAMIFLQFITLCLTFARATGFDVKKFDFAHDLQQLNVDEKDNEEFEVDVELDTDKLFRKIRKKIRYAKYVYFENKFLIFLALAIVIGVSAGGYFIFRSSQDKVYSEGSSFSTTNFNLSVRDSYLTEYDNTGKKINDGYTYLVVLLDAQSSYVDNEKMDNGHMGVEIGKEYFYPTTKYAGSFSDLGVVYEEQALSTESSNTYAIIYEIPNRLADKTMYYKYVDEYASTSLKVKLNPTSLDKTKTINGSLSKKITLEEGILSGASLTLSDIQLQNEFVLQYPFCIQSGCYNSTEYVRPVLDQNYDESLMRIKLNIDFDDTYQNSNITSNQGFVKNFAVIKYKLQDDKDYNTLRPTVQTVSRDTTNTYLEVNRDLLQAQEIILEFQIRDTTVSYKIK